MANEGASGKSAKPLKPWQPAQKRRNTCWPSALPAGSTRTSVSNCDGIGISGDAPAPETLSTSSITAALENAASASR